MATKKRRGARVAATRNRLGISQQELADRVGAGRVSIARIETGVQTPTVDLALALSRELGVSVEDLFGGGD
jgi:DNA-binding XRE family transcriptional regulator